MGSNSIDECNVPSNPPTVPLCEVEPVLIDEKWGWIQALPAYPSALVHYGTLRIIEYIPRIKPYYLGGCY